MSACHDTYQELELYLEKAQEEIGKAFEELNSDRVSLTECCSSSNNFEPLVPPPPAFRSSKKKKHLRCAESPQYATVNRVCYDGNIIDIVHTLPGYPAKSSVNEKLAFPPPLRKTLSSPGTGSFFSKIDASLISQDESQGTRDETKFDYSPETRRRLFQLRSSLSSTNHTHDLFHSSPSFSENYESSDQKECPTGKLDYFKGTVEEMKNAPQSSEAPTRKMRARSFSDTSAPKSWSDTLEDHSNTFPRPPSGDVNLLSIWADNLVLEIDKSFSVEVSDSIGTCNPISECGFCSTKQEINDALSQDASSVTKKDNFLLEVERSTNYLPFNSPSPLPDSANGMPMAVENNLGQVRVQVVTSSVDCVDSSVTCQGTNLPDVIQNETDHSVTVISDDAFYTITPPPPEFDDDPRRMKFLSVKSLAVNRVISCVPESRVVANAETQTQLPSDFNQLVRKSDYLLATYSFCDEPETLEENSKRIYRQPRIIPASTLELEEGPTVSTVCAVAEETCGKSSRCNVKHRTNDTEKLKNSFLKANTIDTEKDTHVRAENFDISPDSKIVSECINAEESTVLRENSQIGDTRSPEISSVSNIGLKIFTLPKQVLRCVETDRLSSSLPRSRSRDTTEHDIQRQRASSSPALSSVSKVSLDEVAAFMRKVKNSTYYPPSREDLCVEVKNFDSDFLGPSKDAVTQTTPIFSRSSSFLFVAECDCSDWDSSNFYSSSEDSLFLSCSNCTPGKQTPTSSSTSPSPLSSEEDEERAPHSWLSSSLSLSACSVNSCDKDCTTRQKNESVMLEDARAVDGKNIPKVIINENTDPATTSSNDHDFSSPLSAGKNTGETVEEPIRESTYITPTEASPVSSASSDSISADHMEQSSSFPSTLKSSKGNHMNRVAHVAINELHMKSASVPLLREHASKRKHQNISGISSGHDKTADEANISSFRNQDSINSTIRSAKELSELQAIEACSWLRAAGFPQYAQMYEDNLFPIEICTVQKDHAFLHPDSIQSLFRRLNTLNRCARMKFMDNIPRKSLHLDESDDEDQCALSENWQFQRTSRRWSRVPSPPEGLSEISSSVQELPPSPKSYHYPPSSPVRKYLSPEEHYCSSHDSVFIDEQNSSPDSVRRVSLRSDDRYNVMSSHREGGCSPGSSSGSGGTLSLTSEETLDRPQRNLRRTGSDRIKEGAKALFRRIDSLKGKRKKKNHNVANSEHKHCVSSSVTVNSGTDGSSSGSLTPSPLLGHSEVVRRDSLDDTSDCSQNGTPELKHRRKGWGVLFKGDSSNAAYSDSECPVLFVSERWKDANCNDTKLIEYHVTSESSVTITTNAQSQQLCVPGRSQKLCTQESTKCSAQKTNQVSQKSSSWLQEDFEHSGTSGDQKKRGSFYDNLPAPLAVFNTNCIRDLQESAQQGTDVEKGSDQILDEGDIIRVNTERRDSGVGSSLTREISSQAPWHCFYNHTSHAPVKGYLRSVPITSLSAPQILVLRKLSLLKLTTLMEKFSPSSRTGWSWGVPKFIRRICTPDYRDKVVFGVPLLLILQRTGQPLPVSIQAAIHYLKKTALDSTGLFRKSGVRSRIQKLRNLNENSPDDISYEDQQAYDVADMLKQYFRELPEALLTNKLSETFISIYQYIPEELRLEAVQAAILLMPDENREVLQSLLEFLQEVCKHSTENQMTATNLAVCFAPSLFHLSTPRSASASPHRRKTVGVPDLRELNENRAAYECLSSMIVHYKELFTISEEMLSQCRLSYVENCEPVSAEQLTTSVYDGHPRWRLYIDSCIHSFVKELKDKSKGWMSSSQNDGIELSYRKVADGHPLRLWKVSTEVEAPPAELLNRILWERHVWDSSFLKWRVLQRLDQHTEIFQYVSSALPPHPPCDYCVLRSWRTDLPKGTCVLIETSIEHPEAEPMISGLRAIILASRFLIEPCGSGKSRITHISRVDTRGRSPEWYNRAFGHICTLQVTKLRDSFSHSIRAEGPETKV